ncbi:MAG: DNA polymerase III subunit delta' [Desulfatibacillaceae bacterium]
MSETVIGLGRPLSFLARLLQRDSVPNALLFIGDRGTGKWEVALYFAMALNCGSAGGVGPERSGEGAFPPFFSRRLENGLGDHSPCRICRSCRKIGAHTHPDVLTLRPEGTAANPVIKVDQVRQLLETLSMHPLEGKRRVVVVTDAEAMNPAAANALLKMLEEPPASTMFVLLATEGSRLLPTIVSRCQQTRFAPLPAKDVTDHLSVVFDLDRDRAAALTAIAGGSVKRAEELAARGGLDERDALLARLEALDEEPLFAGLALAEHLARDKKYAIRALGWIGLWLHDLLVVKHDPARVANRDLTDSMRQVTQNRSARQILGAWRASEACRRDIEHNVNARLALDGLFVRFWSQGA